MIHLGLTDIDMHVPHKETKPMNKKMQNNDTKNTLKGNSVNVNVHKGQKCNKKTKYLSEKNNKKNHYKLMQYIL